MRRADRQVTNLQEIFEVIGRCKVLRIAIQAREAPYIVPMNFGWEYKSEKLSFFLHCAQEGRKLDLVGACNRVGFEMDCSHKLIEKDSACAYSFEYESIIGTGVIVQVCDAQEKSYALSRIMLHQTGKPLQVPQERTEGVTILRLEANAFTCKHKI